MLRLFVTVCFIFAVQLVHGKPNSYRMSIIYFQFNYAKFAQQMKSIKGTESVHL